MCLRAVSCAGFRVQDKPHPEVLLRANHESGRSARRYQHEGEYSYGCGNRTLLYECNRREYDFSWTV